VKRPIAGRGSEQWFVIAMALALAATAMVSAQGRRGAPPPAPNAGEQAAIPCTNDWQRPNGCAPAKGTLKPHDLTGVWMRVRGATNMTREADDLLTPLGRKLFEANKPSFGPRAVPPVLGNDPLGKCDPLGLTRNLFTEIAARGLEFVHLPDRVIEFFEYAHQYRTIWTDGRPLPKDPYPRWMGYSVGRWDADAFVVDSIALDDRVWADMWGHPISSKAHITERYRRAAFDTLELQMTITDPDLYTKPWVSDTKVHRLQVEKAMDERLETFCVPSEEENFNKSIRDPAGGVVR
jgi:hypothetical protein